MAETKLSRADLEKYARSYAKIWTERPSLRLWEGGGENPVYKKAVEEAPKIKALIPKSQRDEFMGIVEAIKKTKDVGRGGGGSAGLMIPKKTDE